MGCFSMKEINYYNFINDIAKVLLDFCDDFDNAMKINQTEYKDDKWFVSRGNNFENHLNAILVDKKYRAYHEGEFATVFISLSDVFYDGRKNYFKKKVDADGDFYYERINAKIAQSGKLYDALIASRDLILRFLSKDGNDYVMDKKVQSKGVGLKYDIQVYGYLTLKTIADIFNRFTSTFYLADEVISIANQYRIHFEDAIKEGPKFVVRDNDNNLVCNKNSTKEHVPYYHCVTASSEEELEAYKEESYSKCDRYATVLIKDNTINKEVQVLEIDEHEISLAMEKHKNKNKKKETNKIKSFFSNIISWIKGLFKSKK